MVPESIPSAIAAVPRGAWAVAVSGGADSVALLMLLRQRSDLQLHVTHLDHEMRGPESTADARFVESLCAHCGVACTISRRGEIEPNLSNLPKNPSARFRRFRFELFRRVVESNHLDGVILAHHADDQAETVLHRLLRSAGPSGLAGMSPRTRLGGLLALRPLLNVRRDELRIALAASGQTWREDLSNASPRFLRTRLRRILTRHPRLTEHALDLSTNCRALRDWARQAAPTLERSFATASLARLPAVLARESARRWLIDQGLPPGAIDRVTIERLIAMTNDAASPSQQCFPSNITIRRRGGRIFRD